jgi:glycine/D-amino acid oxidase-like deaminating enzyme
VASAVLPEQRLPSRTDVLVIGGGYTGLSAARETAAAGLTTCVLEAGSIGTGCSGRNGGQVAYSLKPSFAKLRSLYGAERAFAICREGFESLDYLRALCRELDCDWRECGCFFGAHTPRHFERMAYEARHQPAGLEQRISVVPKAEQREEIGSEFYHGGCVYHDDAVCWIAPAAPARLCSRNARRRPSGARARDSKCRPREARWRHAKS